MPDITITQEDATAVIAAMFKVGVLKMPTRAQQRKANRTGRPIKIAEVSLRDFKPPRRPQVRRERAPAISPRARNRAPRRRRTAGVRAAETRAGPNDPDDPAPLTAAVFDISNAERGSRRHGGAVPIGGNLSRFPLRAIAAVLVCRERGGDGWLALCGSSGWLFGTRAEARREARWLARNRGLPVRELIGGAP